MSKPFEGMRPETAEKCKKVQSLVNKGYSIQDATKKMGVSTASFYLWARHNGIPRKRNNSNYDKVSKDHDLYQEIFDKYQAGENVLHYFVEKPYTFYTSFYNWKRKNGYIATPGILSNRGVAASEYIDKTGCTYQEAAKKFGVSKQRIQQYRSGLGKGRPLSRNELFLKVEELSAEVTRLKNELARLRNDNEASRSNADQL